MPSVGIEKIEELPARRTQANLKRPVALEFAKDFTKIVSALRRYSIQHEDALQVLFKGLQTGPKKLPNESRATP